MRTSTAVLSLGKEDSVLFFLIVPSTSTSILILFREDDHKKLLDQTHVWQGARKTTPRVFCGIYTHQNNHATKVKASGRLYRSKNRLMKRGPTALK